MSLFANLGTEGLEEAIDRIGGFSVLESDIYTGDIKAFYAGKSDKGAAFVALVFVHGGKEYRETVYVTNQKGENWFLNKDDNSKKVPLPGFTTINDICLATTGEPLSAQKWEEKVINIYDYEAKKELPKSVDMCVGVVGQTVSLGILKELKNKNAKDGNGVYQPTAETREENAINKVWHTETKKTIAEATNGVEEGGVFWAAWLEKNKGQTKDSRKIKDGTAGKPGTPPVAGNKPAGDAPKKSLFGKK
jgi:hypothetical protein